MGEHLFITLVFFTSVVFYALLINAFCLRAITILKATIIDHSVIFAIIIYVQMLGSMDDLDKFLEQSFRIFSVLFIAFLLIIVAPYKDRKGNENKIKNLFLASVLYFLVIALFCIWAGGLNPYFQEKALYYVIGVCASIYLVGLVFRPLNFWKYFVNGLDIFACFGGAVGVYCAAIYMNEPVAIGPFIAFSCLSMMYLSVISVQIKTILLVKNQVEYNYFDNKAGLVMASIMILNILVLALALSKYAF